MSDSDEESEIFIFLEGKEEAFTIADANSGEKVAFRFNLDYEPAC